MKQGLIHRRIADKYDVAQSVGLIALPVIRYPLK